MKSITIEVVATSVESCIQAELGGAKRIELCSALATSGVTPSVGLLNVVKQSVKIPVFVMIRPREGDFCYSEKELDVMRRDIAIFKEAGADGIVFGVLDAQGRVNEEVTKELVACSHPLPVTFHRAFDLTPDRFEAMETIIRTGCQCILSSGGAASGPQGVKELHQLAVKAAGRIRIMPGGGITPDTFDGMLHPDIQDYHLSGRKPVKGTLPTTLFEMDWAETASESIEAVVQKANAFFSQI